MSTIIDYLSPIITNLLYCKPLCVPRILRTMKPILSLLSCTLGALLVGSLVDGFGSQSAFTSSNTLMGRVGRVGSSTSSTDSLVTMNAAERTYIMVS